MVTNRETATREHGRVRGTRRALGLVGGLAIVLLSPASWIGLPAGEPAAPATPEPPRRAAAAPRPHSVVTDDFDAPIETLSPKKPETEQEKKHSEALARFMAGRLKEAEGRFLEALSEYQAAVKLDPNAVEVYRALVPLAFALSETEKGLQYAQKAIELDPQDLKILRLLAEQLGEQDKLEQAAVYLERASHSPMLKKDSPAYVKVELQLVALYIKMSGLDKVNLDRAISKRIAHAVDPASVKEPIGGKMGELIGKVADAYAVIFDARRHPSKYGLEFQTRTALEKERLVRYELIGNIFLLADRAASAIDAFEVAAKAENNKANRLAFRLAQAYFLSQNYAAALKHVQTYLDAQLQGQGRLPYELLVQIMKKTGKGADVLPRIEDLAKKDPRNNTLQLFLADQYIAAGREKEGEELIKRILKESHDPEAYVGLANVYRKQKRADDLLDALSHAFKSQSGLDRLDNLLSEIQEDRTLVDGLIAAARKIVASDKSKLDFFGAYLVGRLAAQSERIDAAIEFYALALNARHELATQLLQELEVLAMRLLESKHYQQAADLLKKTLAEPVFPHNPEGDALKFQLLEVLSQAQTLAGNIPEALATIREARKIKADDPGLAYWEATIYSHNQQWEEAIRRYKEQIQKYSGDKDRKEFVRRCEYALSNCYVQKGDMAEGEKILESILTEQPNDPAANNDLGYLYADQGKQLERAEKMIRVAMKAEPARPAYLDSMGWVLFKLGRAEEARGFLEKAVATPSGSDATILEHLGDCHERLKAHGKAIDCWKRALKNSKEEPRPDKKLIQRLEEKLKVSNSGEKKK